MEGGETEKVRNGKRVNCFFRVSLLLLLHACLFVVADVMTVEKQDECQHVPPRVLRAIGDFQQKQSARSTAGPKWSSDLISGWQRRSSRQQDMFISAQSYPHAVSVL